MFLFEDACLFLPDGVTTSPTSKAAFGDCFLGLKGCFANRLGY